MSDLLIAAVVYADGVYPDRAIGRAIEPLRERGIPLAGAIQLDPVDRPGRHPCDLLLENLATGKVAAIAEHRGKEARGCRLDVGILTNIAEAVARSLHEDVPRLLVVNKFGKIEADGGGLRDAIAEAVALGIPVLVGVPVRNLDRWRAFAGPLSVELPAQSGDIADWLQARGLPAGRGGRDVVIVDPVRRT
jgi:nucleoside-triphosphatase THEP1